VAQARLDRRQGPYKIKAFTELNRANYSQVKQAIVLDVGVGLGLSLPISAQAQIQSGKPWDVASGRAASPTRGAACWPRATREPDPCA